MDLASLLEAQIKIQVEAIALSKRWIIGLVLSGISILIAAQFVPITRSSSSDIVKLGGGFIAALSAFPYKEIVPRKERLATYKYLRDRLASIESMSSDERAALFSLANKALEETIKR